MHVSNNNVSFGTQVKISSEDMYKMQQVANPYFANIMGDLKKLQADDNEKDVLEIKNVSVRQGNDETGFVADLVLHNADKIEFKSTKGQVNVNGMDGSSNDGRMFNVYLDLKSKLTNILEVVSKMVK